MSKMPLNDQTRLAVDPTAVARQIDNLPSLAVCLLRLLDGRRTVLDTLRCSPVSEPVARAVIQRCCDLGLARPALSRDRHPGGVSDSLREYLARERQLTPVHPPKQALPVPPDSEVLPIRFDSSDKAFFDSYVPEQPMVDTFSDLLSAPHPRQRWWSRDRSARSGSDGETPPASN